MNDSKVYSAFHNLEKLSNDICLEVDTLMGNISEWADDLEGILEKESKEPSTFLLPKTPKEKNTSRRKARNVLNSKCSVINSTFQNETCNLDGTISTRTRNARRGAASKVSELNTTKNAKLEESKQEVTIEKSLIGSASDATYVLPKASTRTKPVAKVKQPETIVPEPENNELSIAATRNSENISPQKKVSTEPERPSRHKISKTPSESSEERLSAEKTPIIINETPTTRVSRRKTLRALSESPAEHSTARKVSRTLRGSPAAVRASSANSRFPSRSPKERLTGLKTSRSVSGSPLLRSSARTSQLQEESTPEARGCFTDQTMTIKKEFTPKAMSTFVLFNETCRDSMSDKDKTPVGNEKRFSRISKTSTSDLEKTPVAEVQNTSLEANQNEEPVSATPKDFPESTTNMDVSVTETEETTDSAGVPKKKRKIKKEEVKENIEEPQESMRITRTKSKAIKQMMEENESKQADISSLAKKVLNKAKMTSVKKTQLAALLECNSPIPGHLGNGLPFGNLTASKSKYHLLLSSSKKLKTPSSAINIAKSADKDRPKTKIPNGDGSVEHLVSTASKLPKDDLEREIKLKSRKEKEEEAFLKRQNVIKSKQEELRRKNELKHQMVLKQREKLEQEKYHNMIQSEKEKEERHKIILQERQAKVKEEAQKRKLLTQQKIAETVERRRMEEEARIAKLKEMEAEEQRLALEKQREQERQEKRAQERLAQKKAREEYEMQMKLELEAERLKAEKLLTAKKCMASVSKLQSASKRQKFGIMGEKREWDYKPRNEYDYGLEDEHSEVDSEDERTHVKSKPVMPWAKKILEGKSPCIKLLNLDMLCEFLPCYQKSPDIHKMFKMTPSKRIKRSSSAIWNTPSS